MTLSIEEVRHIAMLARLDVGEAELELYRVQLSAILDYAARLRELDTSGIPPTSSVLPDRTVLREDTPRDGLSLESLLNNAPSQQDGQFKVPPVFEAD